MVSLTPNSSLPLYQETQWLLRNCRAPALRTMRQFAESEIVIPDGPFKGLKFRCDRQPYTALWFDCVDSGNWQRYAATGPTQSGKTLSCFIIPLLYHLFEVQETVLCGMPSMEMATDKWRVDILPAIQRSRYRDLLPKAGAGSKGGKIDSIQFRHGPILKFMSGGGDDKSRAGFTSRVLIITETDGLDVTSETSREADKITQMEARTSAYGERRRIYMECTVSTEQGRTWREYQAGTQSKITLHCPHCQGWVNPEREDLQGWREANSEIEAAKESLFFCPSCGEGWNEPDRRAANLAAKIVHREQSVDDAGVIQGAAPETNTLGFRWTSTNNLFVPASHIGTREWLASRSGDEENAEREMRQFVWTLPHQPSSWASTPLDARAISERVGKLDKGIVPSNATLSLGIDIGKRKIHWSLVASNDDFVHVADYGEEDNRWEYVGVERAITDTLEKLHLRCSSEGWLDANGKQHFPKQVFIDAGYQTELIKGFCKSHGAIYLPSIGRGRDQQRMQEYHRPKSTGALVRFIGEELHVSRLPPPDAQHMVEINTDYWKTWLHDRLHQPPDSPGAVLLFKAKSVEHQEYARHLTAEIKVEEFVHGKGLSIRWESKSRRNHWLDATCYACAAASLADANKPKGPAPTARELAAMARRA